jgi:hypothetical protein
MNEIERLRQAIRDLHGCDSAHVQSVAVQETFQGNVVWEEDVEEFRLIDHPRAKTAFAWSYKNDAGETRYVAVLVSRQSIQQLMQCGLR